MEKNKTRNGHKKEINSVGEAYCCMGEERTTINAKVFHNTANEFVFAPPADFFQ
jgi:hypothetical protein